MAASIAGGPGTPDDGPDDDLDLATAWRPVARASGPPVALRGRLGGIVAAAFFGSLVAAGMTGLLVTVAAGLASALGLSPGLGNPSAAAGVSGAVSLMTRSALLGTVLLSYLSGGYVAARMSGSGSALLGVVVWACAQVVGAVVLTLGAVTHSTGGLPSGWGSRAGSDAIDWNLGSLGPSMILAVMVTALAAAMYGSTVGRRRADHLRRTR